jgi:exodeoxyribonuclease V alpha subunit
MEIQHLPTPDPDSSPRERLAGAIERVTYHSETSGFCVLRVKVRGQQDLVTVVGSAATVKHRTHPPGFGLDPVRDI